jgi:excisionase family DNA binding protein
MSEPLLNTKGLASRLVVSRRQVYRLIDRGLPAIRLGSRSLRFDPEAVDRWLADRSTSEAEE